MNDAGIESGVKALMEAILKGSPSETEDKTLSFDEIMAIMFADYPDEEE